ncbi:hypothetical protein F2Q69_00013869 [Brassica cretica]|uniref:Uncharacterized protein n=1 Tax=Brassica cretica TaxID=69181 RepID=A0A8S9R7R5_BRACR|nr:hypothetical protein F2Q69_00013869 [Brassica cretica]
MRCSMEYVENTRRTKKLDGVYYPLNDSISWLTNCMEEMKQDIARIQSATDVARPTSIDNRLHTSIDSRLRTSIDNRIPASVDDNPPHPHSIKSQPDFCGNRNSHC